MSLNDLLELITETIEAENPINIDDNIDDIEEWDSLGVLSLISMLDDLGASLETEKFEDLKTVRDFIEMVNLVDE